MEDLKPNLPEQPFPTTASTADSQPARPRTREVHVTVVHQSPVTPAPPTAELKNSDFKDMFDLYRKQLEHEDTLVNHRISFSTVIQAALVTVFVFVHQAEQSLGKNNILL